MLAILAALREEISDLRRRVTIEEASDREGCCMYKGEYGGSRVLLVQSGIGRERAERATRLVLEDHPVTALLSIGFAGALNGRAKVGNVVVSPALYRANEAGEAELRDPCYSDAGLTSLAVETLKDRRLGWAQAGCVTVPKPVADPGAKRALSRAVPAEIVDMESYWVARITSACGVPFLSVRAVSDAVEEPLVPYERFMGAEGDWRWRGALPYFATHPQMLARLLRLYRNARTARQRLTSFVDSFIRRFEPGRGEIG